KPDLLARRANRIDWAEEGELAKDTDVLCRRWMLIDVDPARDRFISATAEEKKLAEETMLAVRFDTDRVHIDQIVFNPARICKLPGSLARKGDHTKERPQRRARILEAP